MSKKKIDFFYKVEIVNNEEVKVPYQFVKGEKEEYINVCESVEGWGGIPLDVNWAKGTMPYREAEKRLT